MHEPRIFVFVPNCGGNFCRGNDFYLSNTGEWIMPYVHYKDVRIVPYDWVHMKRFPAINNSVKCLLTPCFESCRFESWVRVYSYILILLYLYLSTRVLYAYRRMMWRAVSSKMWVGQVSPTVHRQFFSRRTVFFSCAVEHTFKGIAKFNWIEGLQVHTMQSKRSFESNRSFFYGSDCVRYVGATTGTFIDFRTDVASLRSRIRIKASKE